MEWKYYTSLLASFKNDIWHKSNGSSFFHVNVFLFEVTWLFTWASVIIENISVLRNCKFWLFGYIFSEILVEQLQNSGSCFYKGRQIQIQ